MNTYLEQLFVHIYGVPRQFQRENVEAGKRSIRLDAL